VDRNERHEALMAEALRVARMAEGRGEVPIGALVVLRDRIVSRAGNATLGRKDPTAHAEVMALRRAARRLENHRLTGATLVVTLEPCVMCLGAMVQARISRCLYGAADPKVGATRLLSLPALRTGLNHRFEIVGGILSESCAAILREFFRQRRAGR